MCMKNRFGRMGSTLMGALLLLSVSGVTYSCKDDSLDTQKPSFLGGSIYDELNARGFKYTVRLIEDLGYKDVMSQTGSKTLFVASDKAYDEFFKNNPWGVGSYEQLTAAQKRVLFNGAQLNNAYVLEMMSNASGGRKNLSLRQESAAQAIDSVKFWRPEQLPVNYNADESEKKYWKRYNSGSAKGIYMVADASRPLITHFLEGNMREKNIKRSDVAFVLNDKEGWGETEATRAYVFDARVKEADVVCLNGYFHVLDKVLVAPPNMAEVIRENGDTKIFSHILDRFSAPFYNDVLTKNYQALYNTAVDSVYEKRYFSINSQNGRLQTEPNEKVANDRIPLLPYDPGWNSYQLSSSVSSVEDMAAMFVPNDEAMTEYFVSQGGRSLIERYAKKPNTKENLLENVDQIPLDIIQALVNNLMKNSFIETVPSKYYTIMNDARDQMFPPSQYPSEDAYKAVFTKSLLANNGVVYVMNRVISPADYAAVIAPALYNSNTQVMRTVVRADDSYIQGTDYSRAPLKQYFSTYLKAMQSRFSFFIPEDEGLNTYGYVDPASMANSKNVSNFRYYRFRPGDTRGVSGALAVDAWPVTYKPATGQHPDDKIINGTTFASPANQKLNEQNGPVKRALLIEMVNHHIIVHGSDDTKGVESDQKYFLSRDGAPVIVKTSNRGVGMEVNGGFQEEVAGTPAAYTSKVKEVYDLTRETNKGYGNGKTYILDRPMQATTVTAYKAIKDKTQFKKFLDLCTGMSTALLEKAGFNAPFLVAGADDAKHSGWLKTAAKYEFFVRGESGGLQYNVANDDKLVRLFNNYRYTIYAPTDDAIDAELAKGLPTWDKINDYLDTNLKTEVKLAADKSNQDEFDSVNKHNDAVKAKAQAMVTVLVNFLRYHFQDESLFVDQVTNAGDYATACVNEKTKAYLSLSVKQTPGQLSLTDKAGRTVTVDATTNNILARDANFNKGMTLITSSSYSVIHQINSALLFDRELAGGYAQAWSSPKKARAFVAKFRIKD